MTSNSSEKNKLKDYDVYSRKYGRNERFDHIISEHMKRIKKMDDEILYEADFTLEDNLAREGIKLWYKKGHRVFDISTLVLGIMCIIPAVFYIAVVIVYQMSIFFFVAAFIFLIMHFKGYVFSADTEIKSLHRIFETTDNCGKFHFRFYDNMFEQTTKISSKKFMYTQIKSVVDSERLIIICASGKNLFFVSKAAVEGGKADELTDFLSGKLKENKANDGEPVQEKKLSEVIAQSGEKSRDL